PERLQARRLERLNERRVGRAPQPVRIKHGNEPRLERKSDRSEIRWMLRLRIHADRSTEAAAAIGGEPDHRIERRNRELTVEFVRAEWQALARAKRLELAEREILSEPAGHAMTVDLLRGPARGKFVRHV